MKLHTLLLVLFLTLGGSSRASAPVQNPNDPVVVLRVLGLRDLSNWCGMWSTLYWLNGMQREADYYRALSDAYASLIPSDYFPDRE